MPSPAAPPPAQPTRPNWQSRLRHAWTHRGALAWALRPIAFIYECLVRLHRWVYAQGWRPSVHAGVPTLVIGNVIAGGAGKTPLTIATVRHLQSRGWQVGVIARGYGRTGRDCRAVTPTSGAAEVGDEPLLIARACAVPVFVAPRRIDAARALLAAHPEVQLLICDDGLQHRALRSDVRVCVFNRDGLGNGWMLPAGPLREPWPAPQLDAVVFAAQSLQASTPSWLSTHAPQAFAMVRQLGSAAVNATGVGCALADLRHTPCTAIAATACPEEFFAMLRAQGLDLAATCALPDHADFENWQPENPTHTIICTEKDAVKIWKKYPNAWAVPLDVQLDGDYWNWLDKTIVDIAEKAKK